MSESEGKSGTPSLVAVALARTQLSVTAQLVVLNALIDSHPDKDLLLRAFDFHREAKLAQEQGSALPDATIDQLEAQLGLWRTAIEKAMR